MVDKDRILGLAEQAMGKVKEIIGKRNRRQQSSKAKAKLISSRAKGRTP